jgi:lipopolysaccharide export system protein LptA
MRRVSLVFSIAAILVIIIVAVTYKLRVATYRNRHVIAAPDIKTKYDESAQAWEYNKDDPQTNHPTVRATARSFRGTHDPATFELLGLALKLYDKTAAQYTFVKSDQALFDERTGIIKSDGPVHIVINVPADKDAEDPKEASKRVQVVTSGVTYETKNGKAATDRPASFAFPAGSGKAVGLDYDPNTKILHLKSQIALDWTGGGPAENKFHVESGDLVYKEAEQKVYLSPWSKMQRQTTTIQGQNSVITLLDGRLHQIDSDHPFGADDREGRYVDYSADQMTAMFDEYGALVQITGDKNARVVSSQQGARTTLTGEKANLLFALQDTQQKNGGITTTSNLHLVTADGHAIAESKPLPVPNVLPSETRILRSEHIELEMKPDGKQVQEIRTSQQAQLEFKPNRAEQAHRILNASHLRIIYGANSYVDTFMGWNVTTHTDKAVATLKPGTVPQPALTWSDVMTAKFATGTNQIATLDQQGNFRYQEGTRRASAKKAFLEQALNRITLTGGARVLDDTGSATADLIVMNQANGDMDATGHVLSTHAPDKQQKPGTSMLDTSQPMQAKADAMQTRDNNYQIFYQGHVTMWQGANRISADNIDLNRDAQLLHAAGNVVSELVDNKDTSTQSNSPVYTTVKAPDLLYRDDTRRAFYTGGVSLVRDKMTVTCKQMEAFLTPKTGKNDDNSSLDHAFADGDVVVFQVRPDNRKRTGSAEHGEYFTADDKVVLNGGSPQMVDSLKGTTKGRELTYFSGDDHLIVRADATRAAFTQMKKK